MTQLSQLNLYRVSIMPNWAAIALSTIGPFSDKKQPMGRELCEWSYTMSKFKAQSLPFPVLQIVDSAVARPVRMPSEPCKGQVLRQLLHPHLRLSVRFKTYNHCREY